MTEEAQTFEGIKARLDEIVEAVGDDSLSLDSALDLYEEAIALGARATSLLEQGVLED
ncbi:MAG: exodeoxyribonuclease VII small subunit [Coriobacteriia bacterium]|nr:exodeoxyribonuclease VII small subunit [Coriobacteriia bacterium]